MGACAVRGRLVRAAGSMAPTLRRRRLAAGALRRRGARAGRHRRRPAAGPAGPLVVKRAVRRDGPAAGGSSATTEAPGGDSRPSASADVSAGSSVRFWPRPVGCARDPARRPLAGRSAGTAAAAGLGRRPSQPAERSPAGSATTRSSRCTLVTAPARRPTPLRRRPRVPAARAARSRCAPRCRSRDRDEPRAGLHPRRRPGVCGDRRRPVAGRRLHLESNARRRRHRRHRGARARRHRPGRRAAGDGGQGVAVQASSAASTRCRSCLDTTDVDEIVETVVRDRAVVRRHQPRGHQRAALLRDRAPAAGAAGHPGLPRRPARHRDRGAGRAAQRRQGDRSRAGGPAGRRVRAPARPGVAVAKILLAAGVGDIAVGDRKGILHAGRDDLTDGQAPSSRPTPTGAGLHGHAGRRAAGADVFIGAVRRRRSRSRRSRRWRPTRSSSRWRTRPGGRTPTSRTGTRAVVATGRSDFPNQINNVLAFPGVFRGALRRRAHPDHRGDEAGGGRRDRRRGRRRARARTASSRARSTRGSRPPSAPRSASPPSLTAWSVTRSLGTSVLDARHRGGTP